MSSFYLSELTPIVEEVLQSGGTVKIKPQGISMLPFIRECKDTVLIRKIEKEPSWGEICLYRRANGKLVLHRLVGKSKSGFAFRGDNQIRVERCVQFEQLLGCVVGVCRGDKIVQKSQFSYWLYFLISLPRCMIDRLLRRGRKLKKTIFFR